MRSKRIIVHDFVVMPNHVHILMTVPGDISLEKAMQLIKGGFRFGPRRNWDLRERSGSEDIPTCELMTSGVSNGIKTTSIAIR